MCRECWQRSRSRMIHTDQSKDEEGGGVGYALCYTELAEHGGGRSSGAQIRISLLIGHYMSSQFKGGYISPKRQ